jgi:hypothetical protein
MFKLLFRLTLLSVLLSGWGMAALSLHVVRTPDRIGLIPKQRLGITDTYVDARKWTLSDLPAHAQLVQRVLQANKAELFGYLTDPNHGDAADQLNAAIRGAPTQESSTSVMDKFNDLFGPAKGASMPNFSSPVDF